MNTRVTIEKYDHLARGIGYVNGKIIFVSNALKGEEIKVSITKETKNYLEGTIEEIIKPSSKRIKSACPYYEKCGGCSFWHVNNDEEISIKKGILKDILQKYARINIEPRVVLSDSNMYYRNKIELKIKDGLWGYYETSSHNFIGIEECLIAKVSINNIIKNKDLFSLSNGTIIIRSNYNDEIIIKIRTSDKYQIDIDKLCQNNKIVGIIVNDNLIYGENYFIEKIGNYFYKVNVNSFFQINLDILNKVFNIIGDKKYQNVVDLYCGVGTLGLPLKKEKLFGIESAKSSVLDARLNAKMNKQNDNYYLLGDASNLHKIVDDLDLIIVDPPRNGLNKETLNAIIEKKPDNLIYMSCNPITLARDLVSLLESYDLNEIYLLNMFPKTRHVECLCVLKLK